MTEKKNDTFKKKTDKPSAVRRNYVASLSKIMPSLTRKVTSKQGMAFGALINDWAHIMGPYYSELMIPVKLAFPPKKKNGGTLHIKTTSAASMEIQHLEKQLIERVNSFFGYRAIEKFRIIHDSSALRHRKESVKASPRPLTKNEKDRIEAQTMNSVSTVEDEELKEILSRLGRAIMEKNKR